MILKRQNQRKGIRVKADKKFQRLDNLLKGNFAGHCVSGSTSGDEERSRRKV